LILIKSCCTTNTNKTMAYIPQWNEFFCIFLNFICFSFDFHLK
jgi:hypothetical protein